MAEDSGRRPGPPFADSASLGAWLKQQPREVGLVVLARAALRAVPLIALAVRGAPERLSYFAQVTAAVFRAASLARLAGKYPARAEELGASLAAASRIAGEYCAGVAISRFLTPGMATAGDVALAAALADADAGAAGAAADAAAAVADGRSVWASVSSDALFIETGGKAGDLADRPLWPGAPPRWAGELWASLSAALATNDKYWQTQTRWYDDCLAGRLRDEA
ncbi:MAG: hypothetical protein ABR878_14115 [Roseiarcus sp.]|jgi:hypothetical protein